MTWNRRALALFSAAALGGSALAGVSAASSATAAPTATNFALSASGWSTQVEGGTLPSHAGPRGLASIGCTTLAPLAASNNTAALNLPSEKPLVHVAGTQTRVSTTKTAGRVASNSVNEVASVVLGDKRATALQIDGIRTVGRAWHDDTGYHNSQVVTVARVTRYAAGQPTVLGSIPSSQDLNGRTLTVPDLATVRFGAQGGAVTTESASAVVTGLKIDVTPTGSTLTVGRAYARLEGGAQAGIMSGGAWGSQLTGAGGVANSGKTAPISLPCMGTDGLWRTRDLAGVRVPRVATLEGVHSAVEGTQAAQASARGRSTVARASFGDRNLVIRGISALAHVTRSRSGAMVRSASSGVASIQVGSRAYRVPAPGGTLTIPRIARIQSRVVTTTPAGIRVTGLRVQLLQGSRVESTLNLANVQLDIRRA